MKYEVFWENPGYEVRPELKGDIECDYLIVGGGISGVSTAYFLAKLGAENIVLVEKNYIGSGATGKAAGTLVTRGERDLTELIDEFGKEKAKVLWSETHQVLKDLKNLIDEEKINCDAEIQDTLICGFRGKNFIDVYKEYKAEKDFEDTTKLLEDEDLKKEINSPLFNHGMLSVQHGLCVNPLKLIQGFSKVVEKYGVKIYENTALLRAADGKAQTHHGNIRYKKIIWAVDVDYPEDQIKNLKTTVIVTRQLTLDELEKIGFSRRKKVVWDTRKNESYLKVTKDNRLLCGFGGIIVHKSHRKTDPHFPHLKQLENYVKRVFPQLNIEIEYAWSGHFGVNTHYSQGPFVKFENDSAIIAGAGSQVVCFMAARHIAHKLLNKESPLQAFFASYKTDPGLTVGEV